MALQGHPRLLILAPIESAYATSISDHQRWSLYCIVSEVRQRSGQETPIFSTPLSFNALAWGKPLRISG